jgi:hypothetical protein
LSRRPWRGRLKGYRSPANLALAIVVNGDRKKVADETYYLALFGNSSNSLFTKDRRTGTILNDD